MRYFGCSCACLVIGKDIRLDCGFIYHKTITIAARIICRRHLTSSCAY